MHAAIIGSAVVVKRATHAIGLAKGRRVLHIAEGPRLPCAVDILTDQPFCTGVVIATAIALVNEFAKYIRERLIDGARLIEVGQVGLVGSHAVGHLVTYHIIGNDKATGCAGVITVDHFSIIPEGIAKTRAVMHIGIYGHTGIIQAVTPKIAGIEIIGVAGIDVRVYRIGIAT